MQRKERCHISSADSVTEDHLWLTFHQTKDALLTSRRTVRTAANELVSTLLEAGSGLPFVRNEISGKPGPTPQGRTATQMALSQSEDLPPELLRKIVALAVDGPHDRRQILNLTHISRMWREVAFTLSGLFTEADWDNWPLPLLELWCSRVTMTRTLTIRLGDLTIQQMNNEVSSNCHFNFLRGISARWGRLDIHMCLRSRTLPDTLGGLTKISMPSLQYLKLNNSGNEQLGMIRAELTCMPQLKVLHLGNILPPSNYPLVGLTDLIYSFRSPILLEQWLVLLSTLPNLRHLSLTSPRVLNDGEDLDIQLPLLDSLEVRSIHVEELHFLGVFFASSFIPNLRTLVLTFTTRGLCKSVLQLLVRTYFRDSFNGTDD
jgi:hypothetical protein